MILGSGHGGEPGGKMLKELDQKIWDLEKELADVQKEIAALRIQPCRGDSEIMAKDEKYDELNRGVANIRKNIWDLKRKRQLLISESNRGATCDSPDSKSSS
jgi:peptidoglycan hydrolase CwlO-like protein